RRSDGDPSPHGHPFSLGSVGVGSPPQVADRSLSPIDITLRRSRGHAKWQKVTAVMGPSPAPPPRPSPRGGGRSSFAASPMGEVLAYRSMGVAIRLPHSVLEPS